MWVRATTPPVTIRIVLVRRGFIRQLNLPAPEVPPYSSADDPERAAAERTARACKMLIVADEAACGRPRSTASGTSLMCFTSDLDDLGALGA